MNITINDITFHVNITKVAYLTHRASGTLEAYKSSLVTKLVRLRYLLSDELAIQRKKDKAPEEFARYDTYAEMCVEAVHQAFILAEQIY